MVTPVDVVVLGATGFTGKLVARYLQAHPERASGKFTYAIAGRSRQKLDELVADLKLNEPGTPQRDIVQTIVVDTLEYAQVEEVVRNCKVIINTVGPFWKYSTNVVKACAHNGVHYVDTSGEVPWAKDLIHDFDYIAHKTRAIIVPFCGFDSIPSDISAYLSVRTLKTKVSPKITAARSITGHKVKGGVSGGTIATGISLIEEFPPAKVAAARDPYSICPIKGTPVAAPSYLYSIPQTTPPIRGGFWVMGETNSAVVRRTWALQEVHSHCLAGKKDPNHTAYGPDFAYEEFMITPGTISALMSSVGMGIGTAAMTFTPTRWVLKKFLPRPGQGPSETVMQNGFVKTTNVTSSTVTAEFPEVVHAETIIRGKGDPGYLLTALMVSESALTLCLEHSRLTEYGRQGGLLTPMTAMGDVLIERLRNTGRFEISSGLVGAPKDT